MSPETGAFVPLFLVAPLLVAMALGDMRRLAISNGLVLAMGAVFVLSAPFLLPLPEIGYRLAAAGAVFVLGTAGFALGFWGGGDVKALTALIPFLPSDRLAIYGYTFSAAMAVGMGGVLSLRAVLGTLQSPWCALRPKAGFPMGLSIALSGLLLAPVAIVLSG